MRKQVAITGYGAISGLGHNTREFWTALKDGSSAIRELTTLPVEGLRVRTGAEVPEYKPGDYFSNRELPLLDRVAQFALIAADEALAKANLEITPKTAPSTAVVIGTAIGGKVTDDDSYRRLYGEGKNRVHPLAIPRIMASAAASQISIRHGVTGPTFAVTSACASSAHAIGQALAMIRSGVVDVAIAGGSEAAFAFGLMKAWEAMRVLSTDTCRPFSSDRSGMVLGEGAGVVILESVEHANQRGAPIYAELAGCGMSADAQHITDPSAAGAAAAMQAALADAAISYTEVNYVNAHGTGTTANDRTETEALHTTFSDHAFSLAVSSTKSMHGHALGAAGALELIATVLAINERVVPPTMNFTTPGEGCDLDYVPNTAREMDISTALSNSFAFGGLNAVLAVRRCNGRSTN